MRSIRERSLLPAAAAAFLLILTTACGSTGLGDIFDGDRDDDRSEIAELRGTVRYVDDDDRFIELEGVDYAYGLRDGGDRTRLYYDADTIVEFEGRTYRPEDLEPGDEVVADVDDRGDRLVAQTIDVVHDVSDGGRYDDRTDDRYGDVYADVRGVVLGVDTYDRTIALERATVRRGFDTGTRGDRVILHYDADTRVEFEGQLYRPENLERGDEIAVEVTRSGDRLLAEEIEVVEDVRTGRR